MNLVLTIAMGEVYQAIAKYTHPRFKDYASRIGADFISISEQKVSKTTPHWEKFQIHNLLNKYERIIYFDTDIVLRNDCPNLFDIVHPQFLGAFNEAPFTDRSKELMIDLCKQYETTLPQWDGRYFNTGVMVISRQHKQLFRKPDKEIFNFYEQTYLNMKIAADKILMFELDYKFNRMTCMDKFTGEDRFASYVIHYAGVPNTGVVLSLVSADIERLKQDGPAYEYKRHIYISVTGGYGDQIAAEPAVRFMREQMYPNDEFIVATHWPRLFEHLDFTICEHGKAPLKNDTPYFIKQSLPDPETPQWAIVSHLLCHTVDFSAIALMKRTLPIKDRQIKYKVKDEDFFDLFEIIGDQDLSKWILVHPGKHWNSKTFPSSWWQELIDGIVDLGKTVCIVGKYDHGDPPDYKLGARGTVNVDCPSGHYDLRDLLHMGSFAALLSKAGVLISNDSFPIHLAGAFDNHIILIPSCKHPDYILPWRNGSPHYKAKAIYKKLVIDDIECRPTQVHRTSADKEGINWQDYLPDIKEVLSEVKNVIQG